VHARGGEVLQEVRERNGGAVDCKEDVLWRSLALISVALEEKRVKRREERWEEGETKDAPQPVVPPSCCPAAATAPSAISRSRCRPSLSPLFLV
jgi:hypothetical protein